jgi:hypothetical protein
MCVQQLFKEYEMRLLSSLAMSQRKNLKVIALKTHIKDSRISIYQGLNLHVLKKRKINIIYAIP